MNINQLKTLRQYVENNSISSVSDKEISRFEKYVGAPLPIDLKQIYQFIGVGFFKDKHNNYLRIISPDEMIDFMEQRDIHEFIHDFKLYEGLFDKQLPFFEYGDSDYYLTIGYNGHNDNKIIDYDDVYSESMYDLVTKEFIVLNTAVSNETRKEIINISMNYLSSANDLIVRYKLQSMSCIDFNIKWFISLVSEQQTCKLDRNTKQLFERLEQENRAKLELIRLGKTYLNFNDRIPYEISLINCHNATGKYFLAHLDKYKTHTLTKQDLNILPEIYENL